MIYAEAAYFDGNHCQHVAAYDEQRRLRRIAKKACEHERRTGSRARR